MSETEEGVIEEETEAEESAEGINEPPPPKKKKAEEPDCSCPGGAPGWMATFADMATLLMAFFVLILSFASVNVPKFEQVSGSLKVAFGVKRVIPAIEIPMGETLLRSEFTPTNAENTLIPDKSQKTEDTTKKRIKDLTEEKDAPFTKEEELAQVMEALEEELAAGLVEVATEGEDIIVEILNSSDNQPIANTEPGMSNIIPQEVLEVAKKVSDLKQDISSSIAIRDVSKDENRLAEQNSTQEDNKFEKVRSFLSEQIDQGLVEVERDGDKIVLRLGQQDSFDSGRAQIKSNFENTLQQVGAAMDYVGGIVKIEGHTDNIPVGFGSRFKSNWDLSSARSAAIADYILATTNLDAGNVSVAGFADSKPIESNSTPEGRARNRRIEVIVDG